MTVKITRTNPSTSRLKVSVYNTLNTQQDDVKNRATLDSRFRRHRHPADIDVVECGLYANVCVGETSAPRLQSVETCVDTLLQDWSVSAS